MRLNTLYFNDLFDTSILDFYMIVLIYFIDHFTDDHGSG